MYRDKINTIHTAAKIQVADSCLACCSTWIQTPAPPKGKKKVSSHCTKPLWNKKDQLSGDSGFWLLSYLITNHGWVSHSIFQSQCVLSCQMRSWLWEAKFQQALKSNKLARCRWLTHIILATWEARRRRIVVWGQASQTVLETPSPK
jgi:hypothetical protein